MAAQQPRPRPTGTTPEPYDGKYEGAIAFWNTLENYYTMNDASYPSQGAKIASALTHFKLGTPAGEWASDQIATALDRTPANYGTWAAFKAAFNQQFVPPESQAEAIAKMYDTFQGNMDFGSWYQIWSQHARRANVDDVIKQYVFRRCLHPSLQQKLLNVSPAPVTLDAMVQKARDFDRNARIYGEPSEQKQGARVQSQEVQAERLPSGERKNRLENNLCYYCGKAGHWARNCREAPQRRKGKFVPQRNTITEDNNGDDYYLEVDDVINQINFAPETQFPVSQSQENAPFQHF